jgi:hypothetical protein
MYIATITAGTATSCTRMTELDLATCITGKRQISYILSWFGHIVRIIETEVATWCGVK